MCIILENSRLKVEIVEPGMAPNTTKRFDRAGFVAQVTLDGKYLFCSREPDNLPHPSTGGHGLCSEIVFPEPSLEAKIGQQFPKFGVGLLTKDVEGKYIIHHQYPCEDYAVSVTSGDKYADFLTQSKPCLGYAAELRKRVSIAENTLSMDMTFRNVGEREITFEEYCHNFVTIEHQPIGPGYFISMPVASLVGKPVLKSIALAGEQNGVGFLHYSNEPSMMEVDREDMTAGDSFCWTLSHSDSPATISERVSVLPRTVRIWTIDHIVSPEVICRFAVAPGEEVQWNRTWTFSDRKR